MQPIVYWFKSQYLLPDTSQKQQEITWKDDRFFAGGHPHEWSKNKVSPESSSSSYFIMYPKLFNIAMENGPFIDGLPIKIGDFHGNVK